MTRDDQLKAAVAEAYCNGIENSPEIEGWSNEDVASDMVAYDDDIAKLVKQNITDVLDAYDALETEVTAILAGVRSSTPLSRHPERNDNE